MFDVVKIHVFTFHCLTEQQNFLPMKLLQIMVASTKIFIPQKPCIYSMHIMLVYSSYIT